MQRSRTMQVNRRITSAVGLTLTAALALAACSGGGDDGDGGEASGPITFWTPHVQPERMAAQQDIADEFTEETGIEVEVVAMAGADQEIGRASCRERVEGGGGAGEAREKSE